MTPKYKWKIKKLNKRKYLSVPLELHFYLFPQKWHLEQVFVFLLCSGYLFLFVCLFCLFVCLFCRTLPLWITNSAAAPGCEPAATSIPGLMLHSSSKNRLKIWSFIAAKFTSSGWGPVVTSVTMLQLSEWKSFMRMRWGKKGQWVKRWEYNLGKVLPKIQVHIFCRKMSLSTFPSVFSNLCLQP